MTLNTEKLEEKMRERALSISSRMEELQIDECAGFETGHHRTNVGHYQTAKYGGSGDLLGEIAYAVDDGHYVHGDFGHWVKHATIEDALNFLDCADLIEIKLNEIEDNLRLRIEAHTTESEDPQ